jgi:hypothetical protein
MQSLHIMNKMNSLSRSNGIFFGGGGLEEAYVTNRKGKI